MDWRWATAPELAGPQSGRAQAPRLFARGDPRSAARLPAAVRAEGTLKERVEDVAQEFADHPQVHGNPRLSSARAATGSSACPRWGKTCRDGGRSGIANRSRGVATDLRRRLKFPPRRRPGRAKARPRHFPARPARRRQRGDREPFPMSGSRIGQFGAAFREIPSRESRTSAYRRAWAAGIFRPAPRLGRRQAPPGNFQPAQGRRQSHAARA